MFLALGINHIVVAFTSVYGIVVTGMLVGGLGLGLLPPSLSVWVASITSPAMRGRAVGGLTTALFLGQFLTPIITQPVVEQTSVASTFGLVGGMSLLLAVIFVGTAVRRYTK